jgi:hypothetical protein
VSGVRHARRARATWLIASGQLRVEAIGLLVAGAAVVVASWAARLVPR